MRVHVLYIAVRSYGVLKFYRVVSQFHTDPPGPSVSPFPSINSGQVRENLGGMNGERGTMNVER